ncbi:MAG: hypothetical protein JWN56_3057 [Sphingobacteriales bacterium]|nr:hypothetical protein [Sphingobacteriales bacterium]
MSGGGGGYMPEIKSNQDVDCNKLSMVTSLSSPVSHVILNTKVGDELEIQLITPASLQVFNANGELVGSLLVTQRDRIIKCINEGVKFVAIVLKINGGNCEIRIKTS